MFRGRRDFTWRLRWVCWLTAHVARYSADEAENIMLAHGTLLRHHNRGAARAIGAASQLRSHYHIVLEIARNRFAAGAGYERDADDGVECAGDVSCGAVGEADEGAAWVESVEAVSEPTTGKLSF